MKEVGTIQFLKKNYDFYIEKVFNNTKVEEFKGSGVTKGCEFEDLMKLDDSKSKILEEAALEFVVCPKKAQQILIDNEISDHSPDHFAKFLYCLPIDLTSKLTYMFDTTDDFALKVKSKFVECFSFFDMRIKEFLLSILRKICPPQDFDKRQAFYQFFCEEYSVQNPNKIISGDNVIMILNCIFFFIDKQRKKLKHNKVTLEQFLTYAEETGEAIITTEEAELYFNQIQTGKFLPSDVEVRVGSEGKYAADKNVDFIRKVKKFAWKATPGDIFFWERTQMYKLDLKGMKIRKKEISLNQNETKLLVFKEGKSSSQSLKLTEIIDVEIGITDVFLKYMKTEKFQELIQDAELCLSIKTEKKSFDFYGTCDRDVQTWYDRLKSIADVNNNLKVDKYAQEGEEPSLIEFKYDKVKEVAWEEKIIPNWQKYFDFTSSEIQPKDFRDLKMKYEVPKFSKNPSEGIKMKVRVKTMKFTSLILAGIPTKIKALVYPVFIKNHQNLTQVYFSTLEAQFLTQYRTNPILQHKYTEAVSNSISQYKTILQKSLIDFEDISEKMVKILYIFFEIHRQDMYFSGSDIVMLCFHFVLYCQSDYSIYKCFSNLVLNNDHIVNNLQQKGVDEEAMFNTIEKNTICVSEIRAKTSSDAATEFIISMLRTNFKWGERVISRITKSGLKLKDYINDLRMSFLTSELPLEFTSIVLDHYILKGEYQLVCIILRYLKLKWDEMRTVKNKGLTVTHLFNPKFTLKLDKKDPVKQFRDLQGKYRMKIQMKNILDTQIRMN